MTLLLAFLICQNYQGYPIAPRSTGMGGAATAMGSGAANAFYNAAAIAFADDWTGDVSGNVVSGSLTTLTNEFGQKQVKPALGFQLIPSNLSFEWRGLKLGLVELSDRWGLGVSIVAPFDIDLSSLVDSEDGATFAMLSINERTYSIYNTIGYRIMDTLGVGLTLVGIYRQITADAVLDSFDGQVYESIVIRQTRRAIAHGLGVGVQWRPQFGLRLGLSVRLPVTSVFGFGDDHERATRFVAGSTDVGRASVTRSVESRYELPWRFNFGVAYERPKRFALAADLTVFSPLQYISERDATSGATLARTTLLPVVNVSAGVEIFLGKTALRTGFFTDHSPYPVGGPDDDFIPRINRYGGTLSFTYDRRVHRSEIGILVSGGRINTKTIDVAGGTFSSVDVNGHEIRASLVYSSTLKL